MPVHYQHALRPLLLQRSENPILLGLLGCGSMGGDLLEHMRFLPGMNIVAVADRRIDKIRKQCLEAQIAEEQLCVVESVGALERAIRKGKVALTDDLSLIPQSEGIEAIIDATGKPAVGAEHGFEAIRHGKHLVMMNVESDVTIGHLLWHEAQRQGVVYTLAAGDEPSSTLELVNFIEGMGFTVVAAGKGKNNPLDPLATPASLRAEAIRKGLNPRVLSEFVDGSKTMVEMTALANATGLHPDISGMHGQAVDLDELHRVYVPREQGGILNRSGVVEYSTGRGVAPGVFAIAHIESPRLCARMDYLHLGEGPFYSFYRPYHLTSLEVPISCARAVLFNVADMQPRGQPVAEATAKAKRNLQVGEKLDGIGETCYHGWILERSEAVATQAIPLGLLEGATVRRPIPQGRLLSLADITLEQSAPLVALRAQQDAILFN